MVIVIVAVAASGVGIGLGAITKAKLKQASMKIAAASRFAYGRAVSQGKTVRLLFDFEKGTMAVEEAEGAVFLSKADDSRRRSTQENEEGDGAGVDPWASAKEKLSQPLAPSFGASPFGPITNDEGTPIRRYAEAPLGDNIKIAKLLSPHETDPRTAGKGSIYFFPNGYSERAVLQLSDSYDRIMSVRIQPLTGRARLVPGAFEYDEVVDPNDDESQGDIEEPF